MSRQLTFDLPPREDLRRETFLVTPRTALALSAVDGWRDWPGGKMLLTGPRGSGKSHLAAIWAEDCGALRIDARDLAAADLPFLAQGGAVAVEDAAAIGGSRALEEALFHLHNLLLPQGRLMITAATPPRDWGLVLPDLLSRMQAAAVTRLEAPDDALLSGVLVKLFADRQIQPPTALIPWLLARMPRSVGAAREIVARIDALALARGAAPGLRIAAEVLEELPPE
ncbi:chromosomal replication initiator DnaA [Pseudogemmobacter humi]|uniref:DnaA regulatory inactivator Hda n=1 Tax=Pseudogemmobacter humi TaxID=2483812 RepID=A0A3P5XCS9_9RHOB|nr:chromosomal replication initiator DnaA [Pseudogemmobacter humi]VDC32505.1 DnaA regulatory inactivator Hda [Pseudogemmobacter humi]